MRTAIASLRRLYHNYSYSSLWCVYIEWFTLLVNISLRPCTTQENNTDQLLEHFTNGKNDLAYDIDNNGSLKRPNTSLQTRIDRTKVVGREETFKYMVWYTKDMQADKCCCYTGTAYNSAP